MPEFNIINWRDTTHFGSEDDYRTGFRTSVTIKNTPFQDILNLPINLMYKESITENNGES